MKRVRLCELDALVTVLKHRSFRRSAALLGMSPSALSHVIAGIEESLGIRLFNRTTRSVCVSDAGKRFLDRIRPAIEEIHRAIENVHELRDTPTGTLRISANEISAQKILAPVVLEFLNRYPDMHVDLITDNRPVDIVAEGYDAGIRLEKCVPQDMVTVPCGPKLRFVVVGSPNYFSRYSRPKKPNDLGSHVCIQKRMPNGYIQQWEFEKRGKKIAIDVKGSLTLNNHDLMVEAALNGAGLVHIGEWAVADDIAEGRLIRVLEDWTPVYSGLCLYYPNQRHVRAALRVFIDIIREAM